MRNRIRTCLVVLRRLCGRISHNITLRARLLSPTGSPFKLTNLPGYLKQVQALEGQRGFVSIGVMESIFVGVILLVVVITFLWQQGIPEIIEATGNTSALSDAGATDAQINWATWIGGAIVIFLFIGALMIGLKSMGIMGSGGGGRSGGGRRRFRRKR